MRSARRSIDGAHDDATHREIVSHILFTGTHVFS
jgi:hypothetical protein